MKLLENKWALVTGSSRGIGQQIALGLAQRKCNVIVHGRANAHGELTMQMLLLAGFYTTMILVTLGIMLVFAAARNLGPRVSRTLVGISAIAMAGFGFYELWLGLKVFLHS